MLLGGNFSQIGTRRIMAKASPWARFQVEAGCRDYTKPTYIGIIGIIEGYIHISICICIYVCTHISMGSIGIIQLVVSN